MAVTKVTVPISPVSTMHPCVKNYDHTNGHQKPQWLQDQDPPLRHFSDAHSGGGAELRFPTSSSWLCNCFPSRFFPVPRAAGSPYLVSLQLLQGTEIYSHYTAMSTALQPSPDPPTTGPILQGQQTPRHRKLSARQSLWKCQSRATVPTNDTEENQRDSAKDYSD